MSLVRTLFRENPMMIEITRFRRKFFGGSTSALNTVIVTLAGLIYLGVVALVWNYREEADPLVIVILQTGILTIMAPAMLYSSIAGERERRSWDFLLVAPVTQAQIICGKFAGAATAILVTAGLFLLPVGIGFAFSQTYTAPNYGYPTSDWAPPSTWSRMGDLVEAELLSVAWAMLVCAVTIFFSARCRRGFIALGTTLAFLILGIIVWPILVSSAGFRGLERELVYFLHPFWNLAQIAANGAPMRNDYEADFSWLHGIPQTLIYLGLSVVFLVWAERTLRFADNEVKFIPRRNDA